MPNTLPRMKLSPEEQTFLRHWMYDEVHYQNGPGPAKALQVRHGASPADLGILIAAAIPDVREQEAAGSAAPVEAPPIWPWTETTFRDRVAEARCVIAERRQ
jgi:hypothetical protein